MITEKEKEIIEDEILERIQQISTLRQLIKDIQNQINRLTDKLKNFKEV